MRFDDLRGVQSLSTQDDDGRRHDEFLSVADVVSFFKHFWPLIASSAAICAVLGFLYILTATPTYTAVAQLLIETNQPTGPSIMTPEAAVALDTPQIESQIAVLSSEQIVERAVKALDNSGGDKAAKTAAPAANSAQKPEAASSQRGWLSRLFFSAPPRETQAEEDEKLRQQVNAIQDNLSVKRVGLSYVLELSYRSTSPKTAADVVNALGDAYVQDKIDGRTEAARRSGLWLEARIEEIRRLMNEAALDVQEFKARRDYRLANRPAPSDRDLGLDFLPKPGTSPDSAAKTEAPKDAAKDDQRLANAQEAPTLEELNSRALTYRKIYESYLQAYTDTVQRQSFPGTASRVISRAEPPKRQSSPKRGLTLVASIILGSFLGVGIALVRTALDETVRSSNQLMRKIGAPLLGEIDDTPFLARLPFIGRAFERRPRGSANAFIALRQPNSAIARQLVITAAELSSAAHANGTSVIGVLGISRNVDDAAVCSNIALLNARAGRKTLLVEADTGRSNLTAAFSPSLRLDLKDVIDTGVSPADAVVPFDGERMLSLLFLRNTETSEFWTPERIDKLRAAINELRGQYDNIFVHLPSASTGELTTRAVDGALVISELWSTKVSALEEVASRMRIAEQPLLGVVTANFA